MRTYPVTNESGERHAIEVDHIYLTRRSLIAVVSSVVGVESVRRPLPTPGSREIRLRFECDGTPFEVWEPYGDNSRYWIGPTDVTSELPSLQLRKLENAFNEHQPAFLLKLIGDILSLRFGSLFGRRTE